MHWPADRGQLYPPPRVAFIEWSDPLYVGGHWTPQLIERAGGEHTLNAGGQQGGGKSFPVPASAVVEMDPDLDRSPEDNILRVLAFVSPWIRRANGHWSLRDRPRG